MSKYVRERTDYGRPAWTTEPMSGPLLFVLSLRPPHRLRAGSVHRMGHRKARVGFYAVEVRAPMMKRFEEALLEVAERKTLQERRHMVTGAEVMLHTAEASRDHARVEVELYNLRDRDLPRVVSFEHNRVDDLPVGERQRLGESTAISYDPRLKVIAYLNNVHAVSPGRIGAFAAMAVDSPIECVKVLQLLDPEAYKAIHRMRYFRTLSMEVARPNLSLFGEAAGGAYDAVKLAERYAAGSITVKMFGAGPSGSLTPETVKQTWDVLREVDASDAGSVKQASVTGGSDASSTDTIDFARHRVQAKVELDMGIGPSVPFAAKVQALRDAWRKRGDLIERLVGGPEANP